MAENQTTNRPSIENEASFLTIDSSLLNDYLDFLLKTFLASDVKYPILLYSDPGGGKSSTVKALTFRSFKNHSFLDFRVPSLTVFDIIGYPILNVSKPAEIFLANFLEKLSDKYRGTFPRELKDYLVRLSSSKSKDLTFPIELKDYLVWLSSSKSNDLTPIYYEFLEKFNSFLEENITTFEQYKDFIQFLKSEGLSVFLDDFILRSIAMLIRSLGKNLLSKDETNIEDKDLQLVENSILYTHESMPSATTCSVNSSLVFASSVPCILFLDEINRASDYTILNTSLSLFLDRKIPTNGLTLHPDTIVVAAANPATTSKEEGGEALKQLPRALIDRSIKVPVYPDPKASSIIFDINLETEDKSRIGKRLSTSRDLAASIASVLRLKYPNNFYIKLFSMGHLDLILNHYYRPEVYNLKFKPNDFISQFVKQLFDIEDPNPSEHLLEYILVNDIYINLTSLEDLKEKNSNLSDFFKKLRDDIKNIFINSNNKFLASDLASSAISTSKVSGQYIFDVFTNLGEVENVIRNAAGKGQAYRNLLGLLKNEDLNENTLNEIISLTRENFYKNGLYLKYIEKLLKFFKEGFNIEDKNITHSIILSAFFLKHLSSSSLKDLLNIHKEFTNISSTGESAKKLLSQRSLSLVANHLNNLLFILKSRSSPLLDEKNKRKAEEIYSLFKELKEKGLLKTFLYNQVLSVFGYFDKAFVEFYSSKASERNEAIEIDEQPTSLGQYNNGYHI